MPPDRADHGDAGPFRFTVGHADAAGGARTGVMRTPHGSVDTPAFMAVGTAATVKSLTPAQIARTGTRVILGNTYHLALRPGAEVIHALGGLHRFMGWSGPILTDSGGFQVFSLGKLARIDSSGVTFQNHIDGASMTLTPERAMEIQRMLGSDIAMVFDECLPWPCDAARARESMFERTLPWELRSLACHPRDGRAVFAIGQGGFHADLRTECLRELVRHPFDGFAFGGMSVGETHDAFLAMVRLSTALAPWEKPRYLMGVGSPRELVEAVGSGVDLFDCVLPTRNARNAQALTFDGPLRLRNAAHITDAAPIEAGCDCESCAGGFSRAYLRHLFVAGEMLAGTLVTAHNLCFLQRLMLAARAAINDNAYPAFASSFLSRYPASAGLRPGGDEVTT